MLIEAPLIERGFFHARRFQPWRRVMRIAFRSALFPSQDKARALA